MDYGRTVGAGIFGYVVDLEGEEKCGSAVTGRSCFSGTELSGWFGMVGTVTAAVVSGPND